MNGNFDVYVSRAAGSRKRLLGRCSQCGFAIYPGSGAFTVKDTGEKVHEYCLGEFFDEHMFDYVEKLDTDDE